MKICFDAPDEWENKLDELAKQDGHSNRAAVIRKIVNLFFAGKHTFSNIFSEDNASNATPPEQEK